MWEKVLGALLALGGVIFAAAPFFGKDFASPVCGTFYISVFKHLGRALTVLMGLLMISIGVMFFLS